MARRNRNRQPVAAHSATQERRIQEDRAHAAYYRMTADTIERQHQATASGALPTRLSETWSRSWGASYGTGGVLMQEPWGLEAERDRARSLEDENWLAFSVLERSVENVIGTGIAIKPATKSPDFNAQAAALWKKKTSGTSFDVRGMYTFAALQRQVYRAKLRDGDIGTLLAEEEQLDGTLDPKLQIIEPDRISSTTMSQAQNGTQTVNGVEMNAAGKPVSFLVQTTAGTSPTRVAAKDMIFLHRSARYGDTRGRTAFGGGFVLFDMIMGYLESVVVASRIGASQAMISKKKNPTTAIGGLPFQTSNTTGRKERLMPIQPGMINVLDIEGEELTAFNPSQPQQSFPEAIAAFARFVGLKFGLTLEQVMLDFSRTSYTSSRSAWIQAQSTTNIEQEDFAVKWVSRIYQWFISKCVKNGLITGTVPDEFWAHEWIPATRPWVDPMKEINAAEKAIGLGIDARTYIAMERGYDFEKLVDQNAADEKLMAEKRTADPERLRTDAETYGVAARAGAITPQMADEEAYRKKLGLPPLGEDAKKAWEDSKGVRALITLQNEPTTKPAPAPAPSQTENQNANND
jgi:lambda family phage portal protein